MADWSDAWDAEHGRAEEHGISEEEFRELWENAFGEGSEDIDDPNRPHGELAEYLEALGYREANAEYPVGETPSE